MKIAWQRAVIKYLCYLPLHIFFKLLVPRVSSLDFILYLYSVNHCWQHSFGNRLWFRDMLSVNVAVSDFFPKWIQQAVMASSFHYWLTFWAIFFTFSKNKAQFYSYEIKFLCVTFDWTYSVTFCKLLSPPNPLTFQCRGIYLLFPWIYFESAVFLRVFVLLCVCEWGGETVQIWKSEENLQE